MIQWRIRSTAIRERVGEAAVERCVVSVVGRSVHTSMVTATAAIDLCSREKGDRLHRDVESKSPLMCHVHLHTVGTTETQHQLLSLQQENRL